MRFGVSGFGFRVRACAACLLVVLLGACASAPSRTVPTERGAQNSQAETRNAKSSGGGYYLDDGPGDNPPPNLETIPDAEPKAEPLHKFANRPYTALGMEFVPDTQFRPYKAQGRASWYGRRFHGKRTSSGEPYDMYAMTAAHPTLPIPSYVRVTSMRNKKSIVVRVNDRGPFHSNRLIDLSYTAAHKLGIIQAGSGMVEVESINPAEILAQAARPAEQPTNGGMPVQLAAENRQSGIFLQLGSFSRQQNAETFSARVRQQMGELAEALRILSAGGKYRVHLGPYADESEAAKVAVLIRQSLNIAPVRVVR